MDILGISLIVLWLVVIVAFIWLLVRAFKTGVGWGLGVFFLSPFSAIFYAINYWDEAKKPFLLYMTTLGAAVVMVVYAFISSGSANLTETSLQPPEGTHQEAPIDKGKLDFMEKSLAFLEKFARSEKDKQVLTVMRLYLHSKKTGFTEAQRNELKQNLLQLLQRSDLTEKERRNLEKMLQEIEQQERATLAAHSDNNPLPEKVAGQPKKVAALENQQTVNPKLPSDPPATEPKNTAHDREKIQKQEDVAALKNQPADDTKPPAVSLKPKTQQSPYKVISPAQAKGYIGSTVILIGASGEPQKCILAGVSGNTLHFERQFSAGTFSFSYKASEIRSLKVYQ